MWKTLLPSYSVYLFINFFFQPYHRVAVTTSRGALGIGPGGVLLGILGGGVPPGSSNPDPISDLNIPFSTPVFSPDL